MATMVATAEAEIPTPPPGGVSVSIVNYPTIFTWGNTLTYRYKVQNLATKQKRVLLFFVSGGSPAPIKGGPGSLRWIRLRPGGVQTATFTMVTPSTPPVGFYGQVCLTIWANAGVGAFTCALANGMK